MLKVYYTCYEPSLKKSFVNVKLVKTMADFRLFAFALYSGNWAVNHVEKI